MQSLQPLSPSVAPLVQHHSWRTWLSPKALIIGGIVLAVLVYLGHALRKRKEPPPTGQALGKPVPIAPEPQMKSLSVWPYERELEQNLMNIYDSSWREGLGLNSCCQELCVNASCKKLTLQFWNAVKNAAQLAIPAYNQNSHKYTCLIVYKTEINKFHLIEETNLDKFNFQLPQQAFTAGHLPKIFVIKTIN